MKKTAVIFFVMIFIILNKPAFALEIQAKAAILVEFKTGRVLYEKNADTRLPVASTTKIMTCLIALESASLDESVTAGKNASGVPGTSLYLSEGETLSMSDMLYGLMVRSGNDCAVAIAEHISGSVEEFAAIMNRKAESLGANAYFTTPNGLDEGGNGASARAMALIAREALKNNTFREIVATRKKIIPWKDRAYERVLTNKNKLLKTYEGAIGVKTGFTGKAGRCLVFAAERDGMTLVGVVLNCPDWFSEAEKILDYGFENYHMVTAVKKGERVFTENVYGREAGLSAAESIEIPVLKDSEIRIEYEKEKIPFPVKKGERAGRIVVYAGENEVYETNLVYDADISRRSISNALERVFSAWPADGVLRSFYK